MIRKLRASVLAEQHRLARETRQRIGDYKAGKNLPSQAENESLEVIAEQLDNFLGGGLNQTAMCAAVEPMLHRQKASVSQKEA